MSCFAGMAEEARRLKFCPQETDSLVMERGASTSVPREDSEVIEDRVRELSLACNAIKEHLKASRISIWHYNAANDTLTPYTDTSISEPTSTSAQIGPRWIDTPLAELKPLCDALSHHQSTRMSADHATGRLAELFADFNIDSLWCAPLVLGGRMVGVITVEPAAAVAEQPDAKMPSLLTAAAAALVWFRADRAQAQAELFLDLAELSTHERLGPILARACQGLAHLLSVRRASVFLVEGEVLVPKMSRLSDGSTDSEAWEKFRHPQEPLALVEAVLRSGSPMVAEDASSPLIAGWWSTQFCTNAAMAVPIHSGIEQEILGVLLLDAAQPRTFGPIHIRLASAAATQLGRVIERNQRISIREERMEIVAALGDLFRAGVHSTSILAAAKAVAVTTRQVLGVDVACTLLVDRAERISEIAAVGAPSAQIDALRAKLTGELVSESVIWKNTVESIDAGPFFLAELATQPEMRPEGIAGSLGLACLAAIPLMSSDGPLGVVVCGDARGPRKWRSSERNLLAQLALSATIVVDNARLREAEHHLATHDELTGLANRRSFGELLGQAIARAQRAGETVAVMLVDLDGFKAINDTYGHHRGDAVLVEVARRLQSALRATDAIARLGGDEFAAVLAVDDLFSAELAAKRVAAELDFTLSFEGVAVAIKASVGTACFPNHSQDIEVLLQHADEAMYLAKGKNLASFIYQPRELTT